MAEIDAKPAEAVPEVVAEANDAPAAEEVAKTDAAPAAPMGRIKKPVRPDSDVVKKEIEELNEQMKGRKSRIEAIRAKLASIREAQSKGSPELQAIKTKRAAIDAEFNSLVAKRQQLREQLDAATKSRDAVRASVKEMRGSLRYTTVESIDEAIAELERKQLHESLSLAEEKQVIESIRSLNKSRSAVAELSSKLLTLESDDGARAAIATSLKELDGKLDAAKASRDALRAEQDAAWKAERAKGEDYPALRAEEDALRAENKAVYEQIKGKREALDAAWAQYKSDMTLFRQQIEADRKRRDEEFAARRAEREAARLARIRENAPEPFCHELGIAENLVSHLEKAIAGADKGAAQAAAARQRAEAAEAAKAAAAEAAKSSGLAPLVKTQLEGIQIGAAKGGKKNKRNAKKKSQSPAEAATAEPAATEAAAPAEAAAAETSSAPAAASASASPSDRLTHSLDLLEAFAALGVSVPLRASDAPAALEAVKKEQARYLALKAQAQAEPDNEEVQALARESAAKTYKALGVAPPKELLQGDKAEESKEQDKEGDEKKTNGADADAEPSSAAAAAAKPSSSAAAAKPSSSASKKGGKKGASKPPPALSNATVWPTFGGLGDDEAEAARPAFAEAFAGKSLAQAAAEPPKPKPAQQEEEEQEQEEGEEQPAEEVFVEEVVVEEALEA